MLAGSAHAGGECLGQGLARPADAGVAVNDSVGEERGEGDRAGEPARGRSGIPYLDVAEVIASGVTACLVTRAEIACPAGCWPAGTGRSGWQLECPLMVMPQGWGLRAAIAMMRCSRQQCRGASRSSRLSPLSRPGRQRRWPRSGISRLFFASLCNWQVFASRDETTLGADRLPDSPETH